MAANLPTWKINTTSLTPYPFTKLSELSFEFNTSYGITYIAYFLSYGYMFDDPEFSDSVFTFNLDLKDGDADDAATDERVGLTIVEIFRAFFETKQNVVIYICESADNRHLARKRKFDFWFWKFNDGSIVKEDGIAVIEDVEIYNSLLIHKDNYYLNTIIDAFRQLNSRAGEK